MHVVPLGSAAFLSSLMNPTALKKDEQRNSASDAGSEDSEEHINDLLDSSSGVIKRRSSDDGIDLSTLLIRCRGLITKVCFHLLHNHNT